MKSFQWDFLSLLKWNKGGTIMSEPSTRDIVKDLDLNLRNKSGMDSSTFISEYCKIFRNYAYATKDDSLNEFEKEITHVLGMMIYYKRLCEILGFTDEKEGFDPRDFVWAYEHRQKERSPENNTSIEIRQSLKGKEFLAEFCKNNNIALPKYL